MNDEEYRAIRLCVARAIIEAGGDTPTFDLVMAPLDTLRTNAAASEAALTILRRESATREREVRAEAWEEGYRSGWQDGFGKRPEKRVNPYRSET